MFLHYVDEYVYIWYVHDMIILVSKLWNSRYFHMYMYVYIKYLYNN